MPNAVIAHAPDAAFDLAALAKEAREWPGLVGMDLVPMVTSTQRFGWDETPWVWNKGYGRQDASGPAPQLHVVAIDYGIKRNILRQLAGTGAKVTVVPATTSAQDILALSPDGDFSLQRSGRSGGDRRICGAGDPGADRQGRADLRHLPRPSDARHRGRRPRR